MQRGEQWWGGHFKTPPSSRHFDVFSEASQQTFNRLAQNLVQVLEIPRRFILVTFPLASSFVESLLFWSEASRPLSDGLVVMVPRFRTPKTLVTNRSVSYSTYCGGDTEIWDNSSRFQAISSQTHSLCAISCHVQKGTKTISLGTWRNHKHPHTDKVPWQKKRS